MGFIAGKENDVYSRPVDVAFTKAGCMLVADDASNTIWEMNPGEYRML